MKRVQLTISPPDEYLPPVYRLLTREATYLSHVEIVNWNVADPPVGFLLRVRGDYRQLERDLEGMANVRDAGIFPNGETEAYCFLAADSETVGRVLFENFTRRDLLTVPPIRCYDDGSSTFALVGTESAIQNAVDGIPAGVDVRIEAVGSGPVARKNVPGMLSDKQLEAVQVALDVGYYDLPRKGTTEDVADQLDCTAATASEHLRKAEVSVFSILFDRADGATLSGEK